MTNYIERYWRDAKPEDAIKEPPMVARFGNGKDMYHLCKLHGIRKDRNGRSIWYANGGSLYTHCQVYDVPDPGDGWRLIDPDNDEPEDGDEYYDSDGEWVLRSMPLSAWTGKDIYRRRITPAVTYVPFTWEDREQLRRQWVTWEHENGLMIESEINHISQHRDGGLCFRTHDAKWLVENAKFIYTGEPVGKKVMQ